MGTLRDFLPSRTYTIVSAYTGGRIAAQVGGCAIRRDDSLRIHFPKPHSFTLGSMVTVHLDNRTGVESFDAELRVYRSSYKGIVRSSRADYLEVEPQHYQLFYGNSVVAERSEGGYRFPEDTRPEIELPESELSAIDEANEHEKDNKLGVWITRAIERPHSTVMAFLSTAEDDIFVISHRDSFKSSLIHRNRDCLFAMDHRATFLFEKAVDWNFTVFAAEASLISRGKPLFSAVQARFVQKNPWEELFFTDPKAELFHLKPSGIVCSGVRTLSGSST